MLGQRVAARERSTSRRAFVEYVAVDSRRHGHQVGICRLAESSVDEPSSSTSEAYRSVTRDMVIMGRRHLSISGIIMVFGEAFAFEAVSCEIHKLDSRRRDIVPHAHRAIHRPVDRVCSNRNHGLYGGAHGEIKRRLAASIGSASVISGTVRPGRRQTRWLAHRRK